jgi:hypothetical protein
MLTELTIEELKCRLAYLVAHHCVRVLERRLDQWLQHPGHL